MTGPYLVRLLEACGCEDGYVRNPLRHPEDALDGPGWPCGKCDEGMRVVSVKAFETLDGPGESCALRYIRALMWKLDAVTFEVLDEIRGLTPGGGRVSLPDGREIVVEQTTWTALWRETGKSWLTFHSASPAAIVRIFNEWAAERCAAQEARR